MLWEGISVSSVRGENAPKSSQKPSVSSAFTLVLHGGHGELCRGCGITAAWIVLDPFTAVMNQQVL